jgi:phage portal protein BeeE
VVANAHPAYDLVKYEPNSYQTAYEFWETIL